MKKLASACCLLLTIILLAGCSQPTVSIATTAPTQEKTIEDIKAECTTEFDYDAMMEDSDAYDVVPQYFDAQVYQILENDNTYDVLFVQYDDDDYIIYAESIDDLAGIEEDDYVRVYGIIDESERTYTYETTDDDENTVPLFIVSYMEITAAPTPSPTPEPTPAPDPDRVMENYKAGCIELDYEEFDSDPDEYGEQKVFCTGTVVQVVETEIEGDACYSMRLAVDDDYKQMLFVFCRVKDDKIKEDDTITVYGVTKGLYTYTSTLGEEVTIPEVLALFYEIE